MTFFRTIGIAIFIAFFFIAVIVITLMLIPVDIYKSIKKLFNGRDYYDKAEDSNVESTVEEGNGEQVHKEL